MAGADRSLSFFALRFPECVPDHVRWAFCGYRLGRKKGRRPYRRDVGV